MYHSNCQFTSGPYRAGDVGTCRYNIGVSCGYHGAWSPCHWNFVASRCPQVLSTPCDTAAIQNILYSVLCTLSTWSTPPPVDPAFLLLLSIRTHSPSSPSPSPSPSVFITSISTTFADSFLTRLGLVTIKPTLFFPSFGFPLPFVPLLLHTHLGSIRLHF